MKPRASFQTLVAFAIALVSASADIAPTRFIGSGIAARSESAVRMEKASVEIVWGTPCTLTATFRMVNSSAAPQSVKVGFPMPNNEDDASPSRAPEGLTMTFDGGAAAVTPPSASEADRDVRRDWVWFHCEHTFKPGVTVVVVKTPLRASLVYAAPLRESLFYCIQTGGNWAGTIGEEEVTIRFPYPIQKDQITGIAPAGYEVDGDSVRWRFVDIKPTGKEYDIALTYVRPDVMQALSELRKEVAREPDSSAAAIKLAKHLLILGRAKSNSGFPPWRLGKEEHGAILGNLASAEDRKIFTEHYRMTEGGFYEEISTEWTHGRKSLVQILAEAGYRDQEAQWPFILEAEELLQRTLARDPHNADAWNVYLANYWRFSFAAMGHWFGRTWLSRKQAQLIEAAARNCPKDECIRLWLDLVRTPPDDRDTSELFEAIKQRGFMAVEYQPVPYGYY